MANDNMPRGLVPLRSPGQGNATIPVAYFRVNTASDLYLGQPVALDSTGRLVATSATGLQQIAGVCVGFLDKNRASIPTADPFLDVSDLATGDDAFAAITINPHQWFVIQGDSGGTVATVADVGAAFDVIYRGPTATAVTGNVDSGWATLELDASSFVTTTAAQLIFLGFLDVTNADGTQNATGSYAKMIVRIMHPQLSYGNAIGNPQV